MENSRFKFRAWDTYYKRFLVKAGKDKKGKLIYEGDIYHLGDKNIA